MPALLDLPADLSPTQAALDAALRRVEQRFEDQLASDLPPVRRLCQHVERYRGKMLRPMLVLLSALGAAEHRGAGESGPGTGAAVLGDDVISLAAVCEMIHMATLVLDEADTRRRGLTVNRLHGNETAVILGDYLFSAAYHLCSTIPGRAGREAAILIGRTGMTLCAGELLQLDHRDDYSIDEATYFEIVDRKTASLIAAACRLGAMQAGAAANLADRFERFGRKLGIAFQIQDDLLDLTGRQSVVGKSVGKDVELGKLTLAVIHHLTAASPLARGRTLELLRSHEPGLTEAPPALVEALAQTGSIEHARAVARDLVAQARTALDPLRDGAARRFLLAMADAVVERTY
jgi:octaprenyl-diphosphate synthase